MHLLRVRFSVILTRLGWFSLTMTILCQTVFGQQKQADSLQKILNSLPKKDTIYIGLLNKLAFAYAAVDNEVGMHCADEAVFMAKSFKANRLLGEACMMRGWNYDFRSQPKNALLAYLQGLEQFEKLNNKKDIINACIRVCVSYYNTADYIEALDYGNKALALSMQTGDQRWTAVSYNAIGSCYMLLADYPRAGSYFYKELRIAEKLQDKLMIAKTTGNLGLVNY